jgi:DNA polymerase
MGSESRRQGRKEGKSEAVVASTPPRLYEWVVTRSVDSLIDFLQAEQARGRSHVFLDDSAREGLRELYIRMRKPVAVPAAEAPAAAPLVKQDAVVSGSGKSEQLAGLRKQAESWAPARALGTLREKMVFATGNPDAEIMLVGEAPGYNEEKEGEPFVGPAGQKLNDILKAMGLQREDVYISNLVKFRPSLPKQTTNNRKPSPEEMTACLPLVMAEISVVQPKLIIALGGTTAEGLLGLEGTVGSMRGKWHELSGLPARVTYHPSYLLQNGGSNDVKRALWEDMLAAMEKLGMPISEKQRGFFLPKG